MNGRVCAACLVRKPEGAFEGSFFSSICRPCEWATLAVSGAVAHETIQPLRPLRAPDSLFEGLGWWPWGLAYVIGG